MDDNIVALESWAQNVINSLSPANRKKLIRSILIDLRRDTQKRITAQQGPDGEAWEARKSPKRVRNKQGRIKNKVKMMQGLRKVKSLRVSANSNEGQLGYTGATGKIARVHHYGLVDKINRYSAKQYRYPARALLGMSDTDRNNIEQNLLRSLNL